MPTTCPVCGDEFGTATGARDHAWDAHGACHHCAGEFDDRETLYTHWLDAHEGDLTVEDRKRAETKVGDRTVCPVCGERFAGDAGVRDHAREAHDACHHCGDAFDDEEALYTHWLVVHGDDLARRDRERARSAVGRPSFRKRLVHGGPGAALSGADVDRRTALRTGAVAAVAATGVAAGAGLLGGSGPDDDGGGSDPDDGGSDPGGQSSFAHPSAAGLDAQPYLGPQPGDGPATIVAFEDPSCPSCARFETNYFPAVKSQLVDGKDVTFVFRGIPVINVWGPSATEAATLAMEAAFDRDAAAFWSLKAFYYANQRRVGGDVLGETRRFLAERTGVDADAVLSDVESGAHSEAVRTDLAASRNANVRGTPTFFLFRDGELEVRISGPRSASYFADALGV